MVDLLPNKTIQEENLPSVERPRRVSSGVQSWWRKLPISPRNLRSVGLILLLVGVVTGLGEYFVFPRLRARQVASQVYPGLVAFEDSLEEVNTLVGDLFTLISGEESPSPQVSFNLPELLRSLRERVAGERTKFGFYDLLSQARKDLVLISASFSGSDGFGSEVSVAGAKVSQLESQADIGLRLIMEKARVCGDAVSASRDQFVLFSAVLPQRFPKPLSDVGADITTLVQESETYLTEAERAAHYYVVLTDVQIDLVPATISLVSLVQDLYLVSDPGVYLGTIDALVVTVDELAQRIEGLSDLLPSGIERLHEDNLEVFTLFTQLLDETRAAVAEDDFGRFDDAVIQFEIELEVLATRAKTYELSFWQKTPLLKDYARLVSQFNQVEGELEKFK